MTDDRMALSVYLLAKACLYRSRERATRTQLRELFLAQSLECAAERVNVLSSVMLSVQEELARRRVFPSHETVSLMVELYDQVKAESAECRRLARERVN